MPMPTRLSPLQASAVRLLNQLAVSVISPGSGNSDYLDPGAFFRELGPYSNATEFKHAMMKYLQTHSESRRPFEEPGGSGIMMHAPARATKRPQDEGTTIRAPLARRITGLGEEGRSGEDAWKAIIDCVEAAHTMYNVCDIIHGDVTDRSVCLTFKEDGSVKGVLVDLDDYDPEEIKVWREERLELGRRHRLRESGPGRLQIASKPPA